MTIATQSRDARFYQHIFNRHGGDFHSSIYQLLSQYISSFIYLCQSISLAAEAFTII